VVLCTCSNVRNGHACWVFSASTKSEFRDGHTVIMTMDTWFAKEGGEVLSRRYRITHSSMVLDFDISIRVENQLIEGELVPRTVDYDYLAELATEGDVATFVRACPASV